MPRNIDRSVRRKTRLEKKPAFKKAITKLKRDSKRGEVSFTVLETKSN